MPTIAPRFSSTFEAVPHEKGDITPFNPGILQKPASQEKRTPTIKRMKTRLAQLIEIKKTFSQKMKDLREGEKKLLEKEKAIIKSLTQGDVDSSIRDLNQYKKSTPFMKTLSYFERIKLDEKEDTSFLSHNLFKNKLSKHLDKKANLNEILIRNMNTNARIYALVEKAEAINVQLELYTKNQIAKYLKILEIEETPSLEVMESQEFLQAEKEAFKKKMVGYLTRAGFKDLSKMTLEQLEKLKSDLIEAKTTQESIKSHLKLLNLSDDEVKKHFPVLATEKYDQQAVQEIQDIAAQKANLKRILELRKIVENEGLPFEDIAKIPIDENTVNDMNDMSAHLFIHATLKVLATTDQFLAKEIAGITDTTRTTRQGREKISLISRIRNMKGTVIDRKSHFTKSEKEMINLVPYNYAGEKFLLAVKSFPQENKENVFKKLGNIYQILSSLPQPEAHIYQIMSMFRGNNLIEESDKALEFARDILAKFRQTRALLGQFQKHGIDTSTFRQYINKEGGAQDYNMALKLVLDAIPKLAEGKEAVQSHLAEIPGKILSMAQLRIENRNEIKKILQDYAGYTPSAQNSVPDTEYLAQLQTWKAKVDSFEQIKAKRGNYIYSGEKKVSEMNFSEVNYTTLDEANKKIIGIEKLEAFFLSKNILSEEVPVRFDDLGGRLALLKTTEKLYLDNTQKVEGIIKTFDKIHLSDLGKLLDKSSKYDEFVQNKKKLGQNAISKSDFLSKSTNEIRNMLSQLRIKLKEIENVTKIVQALKSNGIAVKKFTFSKKGMEELERVLKWKLDMDEELENQIDVFALSKELLLNQMSILKDLIKIQRDMIEKEQKELELARDQMNYLNAKMPEDDKSKGWTWDRSDFIIFMKKRSLNVASNGGGSSISMTQIQLRSNLESVRGYVEKKNSEIQMLMQEFDHLNRVRLENPEFIASIIALFHQTSIFSAQNF